MTSWEYWRAASARPARRSLGLRTLDDHGSWKSVAHACHASGGQTHE